MVVLSPAVQRESGQVRLCERVRDKCQAEFSKVRQWERKADQGSRTLPAATSNLHHQLFPSLQYTFTGFHLQLNYTTSIALDRFVSIEDEAINQKDQNTAIMAE